MGKRFARMRAGALLLGIIAALAATTAFSPPKADPTPLLATANEMSDLKLYHAVAAEVAEGRGYYSAAVELQRANDFPVKPFVTVRLPTVAWAEAILGDRVLLALQALLLVAGALAWFEALKDFSRVERYAAFGLYALAGGSMIGLDATAQHEVWAGLLVSLALPLARRFPLAAILLALAASLIRELAAPFLLLIALIAWPERDRATAAKAGAALALVGAALVGHYFAVAAVTSPSDPASQGWLGWGGTVALATDVSAVTAGQGPAVLYVALGLFPLLGWLALPGRPGRLAVLWFAGVLFAVMVLARPDNLRWINLAMPAYFVGLALVPRALAGILGKDWPRQETPSAR